MAINTEIDKMKWKIKVDELNKLHPTTNWKDYQKLHKFTETNYSVKEVEWKMLDYANPSWTPALSFGGHS